MNTIEKNVARILSLDEIKRLSPATVIYRMSVGTITEDEIQSNDFPSEALGICYAFITPAMICESGDNGFLVGGDSGGTFDSYYADNLDGDQYWDSRPTIEQVHQYGITEEEYNAL